MTPFFSPAQKCPERVCRPIRTSKSSGNIADGPSQAYSLQKYLVLHNQHDAILKQLSAPPAPARSPIRRSSLSPTSSTSTSSTDSTLSALDEGDERLYEINMQIKTTLTDMLNLESVRRDPSFRM